MRYILLTLLVFALAAPALAVRTEQILQMSDDSREGFWSIPSGAAQWFEAPVDCHVLSASFYCIYNGTKDVGVWDNDDSGADDLPGTSLGSVSHSFTPGYSYAWSDYVDITSLGLTMSGGEKFWVGIVGVPYGYPYLGLDTTDPDYGHCQLSGIWYWVPNYDLMLRVKIDDDMDGPYASDQDPADGATGVPVDSDIVFHIEDDDIGVDISTINTDSVLVDKEIPVNGKIEVTGSITIDDTNPNDVVVTFDPDNDFEEGAIVTVTVSPPGNEILDGLGNVMAEDSWSFEVFYVGVESASLGEIKAGFAEPEGDGAAAPGAETVK